MGNIQFKVFSELYGETDAIIIDLVESLRVGYCPCGDGCDYRFTEHELNQLMDGYNEDTFIPSSGLKYPLNLIALMRIDGNRLLLPNNFKFDKKQYNNVKNILNTAGGNYTKNSFSFSEDAKTVYLRIINGGNFNLKKKFQFFGTPDSLADKLVELAEIDETHSILEPSAGQGAIIHAINRVLPISKVHYCELMPLNKPFLDKIEMAVFIQEDFLALDNMEFDRIIANPPFSKNQDIDHIYLMYNLLKTDGRLVSIASKHWQTSSNKKETEFRAWIENVGANVIEVEAGEFKESGTSIATVIIMIDKQ